MSLLHYNHQYITKFEVKMVALISQVLTIASNYLSAWVTKKRDIILFKCLSSLFSAISIVAVGNIVGAVPVFYTIIRCIVCFQGKIQNKLANISDLRRLCGHSCLQHSILYKPHRCFTSCNIIGSINRIMALRPNRY